MPNKNFPDTKTGMDTYLNTVHDYIKKHKARLKISNAKVAKLNALMGNAATDGTWHYLWPLYFDKKGKRTTLIKDELVSLEKKLKSLLREIYNDIPASLWNSGDRATFWRKTGKRAKRTRKVKPIADECFAVVTHIGKGIFRIKVQTKSSSTGACLHPNSDGFQIVYKLIDLSEKPDENKSELDIINEAIAPLPKDCPGKEFFSRSNVLLDVGEENTGKIMKYYVRWYHSKHASLAGPWGQVGTETVP